jgi:hypothetical protein
MINLTELIKDNRSSLSPSSIRTYSDNVYKLHQKMYGQKEFEDLQWLKPYDTVIKFLEENYKSYLSVRNILNAMIIVLIDNKELENSKISYQNFRDDMNDRYQKAQEDGVMTDKEQTNWVELDRIDAFIAEMNNNINTLDLKLKTGFINVANLQLAQDLFLVKFHTVYPLRNDLAETAVVSKKDYNKLSAEDLQNGNYIIVSPNKVTLHIANYKTKNVYGSRSFTVDDKHVLKYLRLWLKISPNPKWLLLNLRTDQPFNRMQLTQYFLRIFSDKFGKKVSTTLLRKIVVSTKHGQNIRDLDELAFKMCHSRATQASVYNKVQPSVQ